MLEARFVFCPGSAKRFTWVHALSVTPSMHDITDLTEQEFYIFVGICNFIQAIQKGVLRVHAA